MIAFSELYEQYADFKETRKNTTPADFEEHLAVQKRFEEVLNFELWVSENYPEVVTEFHAGP